MRHGSPIWIGVLLAVVVPAWPSAARAAGPVVVENPDHGLWDDAPRRNFQLLENLYLGSPDGDDAFGKISDVAIDSHGRWIILDGGFNVVRIYDPETMTLTSAGEEGEGPGEFRRGAAVAVDAADRIYVAAMDGRVVIFDPDGTPVKAFRHGFNQGGWIWSMRVGAGGLYLACLDPTDHNIVHRFDSGFDLVSSFSPSHAKVAKMSRNDELAYCNGAIDLDRDGIVYFTQSTPYEIRKYSPQGRLLLTIHRENDFMTPPRIERYTYHLAPSSVRIIVLPEGQIMNIVAVPPARDAQPWHTIVDLFDAQGRFLKSRLIPRRLIFKCCDPNHRLYAVGERGCPVVVRYELELP